MRLEPELKRRLSPSEIVRHHLLKMALVVDPSHGRLNHLCDEIDVHPTTVSQWIKQGYIPSFQLRKLEKRFGELAPVEDLGASEESQ